MEAKGLKRIALFSNYSWAYLSSDAAKRNFPGSEVTLITANTEDVAKKHEFGINVIELTKLRSEGSASLLRQVRMFGGMGFDAAVIDQGFSLNTVLLVLAMRFKRIFVIDLNAKDAVKPITKIRFLGLFGRKLPYFVNKALIQVSKKLRLSVSLGLPSEISIETTTICNLRCKGCPTGLGQLDRPPMLISRELFRSITENNRGNFRYFDIIYPFIFGEPLLNKDMIGYLKRLREISPPYTRIEVHTNGNISDSDDLIRRLLQTGIDMVSISVDGTDKAAYENFRQGASFELVCDFVKKLTAVKKEMNLARPEIVMQMILTKYSEGQAGQAEKLKEELGVDRLTFKGFFHEFTGMSDEEAFSIAPSQKDLTLDREQKKEIIDRKKNLCGWAYRSISIMCNGNVTPCCIDYNTKLLGGLNINNDVPIGRIWNSAKYRRFRRDMLRGRISICNKCFFS